MPWYVTIPAIYSAENGPFLAVLRAYAARHHTPAGAGAIPEFFQYFTGGGLTGSGEAKKRVKILKIFEPFLWGPFFARPDKSSKVVKVVKVVQKNQTPKVVGV